MQATPSTSTPSAAPAPVGGGGVTAPWNRVHAPGMEAAPHAVGRLSRWWSTLLSWLQVIRVVVVVVLMRMVVVEAHGVVHL